ncbi:LysR substrate-binding domain-containing protein [Aliamphritea spongicola]|uniref:LysR substrate-binding domain-containing protein n=1 Tax=Aliamphritea spongicola TaxID=707589 RepID=UPI00196A789C|nr:LysR substrate-binding domain-containing protein [Aliamphritea spongicola]MBN3562223.1 LysR family transcriptional regulator [Aliamphritea spongicola]
MNLSIRQLQAFREVMRTGSISEAARVLNRTQPAVSSMIASLEEELGIQLFERQRGRLIRQPEAVYFFEETEAILERLQQSARTMKEIASLKEGRLRIACMPASSQFIMPRLVADFIRDKPKVKVSMMMRASAVIEEWIASQQYDVGLAETPPPNAALAVETFELPCVCAMPKDDPLASREYIQPRDIADQPLAVLQEDHPNLIATRRAFKAAKAGFNPRFELRNFQPALTLVEEGLCYTICDPMTASSYFDYREGESKLVFRPFLPVVPLSVSILQPAHRPASRLAAAFIDILRQDMQRIARQFQN